MKNYIGRGDNVTLAAPYARLSGQGMLVGSLFAVASNDVASGATVEGATTGVFDLTKTASQAWTLGVALYWDDTNKAVTTTSTSNTKIGVAILTAASADVIGRVRLNGAF